MKVWFSDASFRIWWKIGFADYTSIIFQFFRPESPVVFFVDQHSNRNEQHRADSSHRTGYVIEKSEPLDIDVEKLFGWKQRHRTHIAYEVNHGNKESDIPLYPETSDETVEKDGLESQVDNIERKALHKQPGGRLQVKRFVMIYIKL